jgi:hypothetical protein
MGRPRLGNAVPDGRRRDAQPGGIPRAGPVTPVATLPYMRRTAFFLVVLITGLVLLIDKTQQDEVEADPTAQLFEGK